MSQVLIVEDDRITAMQYKVALEARNHKVSITHDGEECLRAYSEALSASRSLNPRLKITHPYDTVIIDYKIPKINGAQVAMEILSFNPRQKIVFATAYMSELLDYFPNIARLGRYVTIIPKPFEYRFLIDVVEDRIILDELRALGVDVDALLAAGATHDDLVALLEKIKALSEGDDGGDGISLR